MEFNDRHFLQKIFNSELYKSMLLNIGRKLVLLLDEKQNFVGCGVFVLIKDKYYIITAEHVMEDMENAKVFIFYNDEPNGTDAELYNIKLIDNTTIWKDKEHDIAIIFCPNKPFNFLSPLKIENHKNIENIENMVLLFGITGTTYKKQISKYKYHNYINDKELETYSFYSFIKKIDNQFIIIDYQNELHKLTNNYDLGDISKTIKPEGLSGSAVWLIAKETIKEPEMIGIAIRHNKLGQTIKIAPTKYILNLINNKILM